MYNVHSVSTLFVCSGTVTIRGEDFRKGLSLFYMEKEVTLLE